MNHAKTAIEAIVRAGCTLDPALLGTLFAGERAEGYRHATADAAARLAAVDDDLDNIMADYVGPLISHEAIAIILDMVSERLRAGGEPND